MTEKNPLITIETLRAHDACAAGSRYFAAHWTEPTRLSVVLRQLLIDQKPGWARWLLIQFSASARERFRQETAAAWERYDQEIAAASKRLRQETAAAWERYDQETAAARERCDQEIAAARERLIAWLEEGD